MIFSKQKSLSLQRASQKPPLLSTPTHTQHTDPSTTVPPSLSTSLITGAFNLLSGCVTSPLVWKDNTDQMHSCPEDFASLGIMRAQLRVPLKPSVHLSTIILRDLMLALNFFPFYAEKRSRLGQQMIIFPVRLLLNLLTKHSST